MADVYFEISDTEISREEVRESTDVAQLTDWLKEQTELGSELAIMISAIKDDPDARTIGLSRKLGFVRMSSMWIRNRLKALGVDDQEVVPSYSPGLKAHLAIMEKSLADKTAKLKAANIELTSLRTELKACKARAPDLSTTHQGRSE